MELVTEERRPIHWWVREHLPPSGRQVARRVADALLAPAVGSVVRVNDTPGHCALTFDDGPSPDVTPRLLDTLADKSTTATFFLLVGPAERHGRLVRRMVAEGHQVALHGRDHRRLTSLTGHALDQHLQEGRDRLEQVAGVSVRLLRPPYGAQSLHSYRAIRRAGMHPVVWSRDLQDWVDQSPAELAERAANVMAGDIVLLHETLADDPGEPPMTTFDRVRSTDLILGALARRGLSSTTVSDLVRRGRVARCTWFRP